MVQIDLTEGSVGIRRFCQHDILSLYAAVRESAPELASWMVWYHPKYSLSDTAAFVSNCDAEWERGSQYSFAIYSVENGTLLGSVGLNQINRLHNFANLGYWVRSSATHHGVATTAVRLAARFGIQELALGRLELLMPVANEFSRRVAEKVGARNEGILRRRLLLQNQLHDAHIFSLVAGDLENLSPRSKNLQTAMA